MTARRTSLACAIVALILAVSSPLLAHPGAATDVSIAWRSPTRVRAELTTSAEALALKLSALAGRMMPRDDPRAQIEALRGELLERVSLSADGLLLSPRWLGLGEPADPRDREAGKVVVAVEFDAPPTTSAVAWQTDLVFGSYLLVIRHEGHDDSLRWLQGPERSEPIQRAGIAEDGWLRTAWRGAAQGFVHIVPRGLDHILFVVGLFLLTPSLRPLLAQVTVFTVAHSLTLVLTAMGVIGLPASVVEPLIAASIVYVAVENLRRAPLGRARLLLIFAFGLLHGMGFAGVLSSLDLPTATWLTSLISFNVGVEAGQVSVLAAAALATRALALPPAAHQRWVIRPASIAIAAVGALWVIERL